MVRCEATTIVLAMGLLDGKRILVTGVLNDDSIAFAIARRAQEEGAEILLTSFGRVMSITKRVARKLPTEVDVLELDVTDPAHVDAICTELRERWGSLDGAVHSVAYANPETCLGGNFLTAPWDDVSYALHVSTFSLKTLAAGLVPLFEANGGGSVIGLDFDNGTLAWPGYDWMGVAKAALQSTSRYLARDLGPKNIRVNLIAAGPYRSMAAKSIPGFDKFEDLWGERAPLGWDNRNAEPMAGAAVALLSDLFPATTGEVIHVDGGFHAIGG